MLSPYLPPDWDAIDPEADPRLLDLAPYELLPFEPIQPDTRQRFRRREPWPIEFATVLIVGSIFWTAVFAWWLA